MHSKFWVRFLYSDSNAVKRVGRLLTTKKKSIKKRLINRKSAVAYRNRHYFLTPPARVRLSTFLFSSWSFGMLCSDLSRALTHARRRVIKWSPTFPSATRTGLKLCFPIVREHSQNSELRPIFLRGHIYAYASLYRGIFSSNFVEKLSKSLLPNVASIQIPKLGTFGVIPR